VRTEAVARIHHPGGIHAVALSPDGRLLAIGGRARRGKTAIDVVVWDLDRDREIARLIGLEREVQAIAFSTDARVVAAASPDHLCAWILAEAQLCQRTALDPIKRSPQIVFEPDGTARRVDTVWVHPAPLPGGRQAFTGHTYVIVLPHGSSPPLVLEHAGSSGSLRWLAYEPENDRVVVLATDALMTWRPGEPRVRITRFPPMAAGVWKVVAVLVEGVLAVATGDERLLVLPLPGADTEIEVVDPRVTRWREWLERFRAAAPSSGSVGNPWEWDDGSTRRGVKLEGAKLSWYAYDLGPTSFGGGHGTGEDQTIESFLAQGPVYDPPEGLLQGIVTAVLAVSPGLSSRYLT
jgi:dipeptidyl aminopeptidase/acylaminoacyl peptidase